MLVVLASASRWSPTVSPAGCIYKNAAAMMGGDKKDAMDYIQDPSTLTGLGDVV